MYSKATFGISTYHFLIWGTLYDAPPHSLPFVQRFLIFTFTFTFPSSPLLGLFSMYDRFPGAASVSAPASVSGISKLAQQQRICVHLHCACFGHGSPASECHERSHVRRRTERHSAVLSDRSIRISESEDSDFPQTSSLS